MTSRVAVRAAALPFDAGYGGGGGRGEWCVFVPAATLAQHAIGVGAYAHASLTAADADSKSAAAPTTAAAATVVVRIEPLPAAVAAAAAAAAVAGDSLSCAGFVCPELGARLGFGVSSAGASAHAQLQLHMPAVARSALPIATRVIVEPIAGGGGDTGGGGGIDWSASGALARLAPVLLNGRVVSAGQTLAVDWLQRITYLRVTLVTGPPAATVAVAAAASGPLGAAAAAAALDPPLFVIGAQTNVHVTDPTASAKPRATTQPGASSASSASSFDAARALPSEAAWLRAIGDAVCGVESVARELVRGIRDPLVHSAQYDAWRVWPTHCFLVHGLPGTGKTALLDALATHSALPVERVAGAALYSKYQGDSEQQLQSVFDRARSRAPCIVLIDELDALTPAPVDADLGSGGGAETDSGGVEQRVVTQLRAIIDQLNRPHSLYDSAAATAAVATTVPASNGSTPAPVAASERPHVFVLATTNRLFGVDSSLRRSGRFERIIELCAPNQSARRLILQRHCHALPFATGQDTAASSLSTAAAAAAVGSDGKQPTPTPVVVVGSGSFESAASVKARVLDGVAERTHGFVGADLERLCRDAVLLAMRRIKLQPAVAGAAATAAVTSSGLALRESDFLSVLQHTRPSNLSSTEFSAVPASGSSADAAAADPFAALGGLHGVVQQLRRSLIAPLQHPEMFARAGVRAPRGVLLYGPSGCGKTALAMAAARACRAHALCVHATQLVSAVVGDSERAVRALFATARASAPCVLVIDQLEVLAPRRAGAAATAIAATALPAGAAAASPLVRKAAADQKDSDHDEDDDATGGAGDDDGGDGDGDDGGGSSSQFDRILSALLTEMDGILTPAKRVSARVDAQLSGSDADVDDDDDEHNAAAAADAGAGSVVVIATTSLPHRIDPALLRSGRLDQHVFVPPPDTAARLDILTRLTAHMPIRVAAPPAATAATATAGASAATTVASGDGGGGGDGQSDALASRTDLLRWLSEHTADRSGADLASACQEAAMHALRADRDARVIDAAHFQRALQAVPPSLKGVPNFHPL